jgi:hypothetical protein
MRIKTILFTLLYAVCTLPVSADLFRDGDFRYNDYYNNDGLVCEVDSYYGAGGEVTIPSVATWTVGGKVTQYPVTRIAGWAFENCITSLTIPNSVTEISFAAFSCCSELKDIIVSWPTPIGNTYWAVSFDGVDYLNCTLHVPPGTEALYKAHPFWGKFYIPDTESLTVSLSALDFIAAGETLSIDVTANVNWTVSKDAAWISISPASGSNNGTINVTTAANTETSPRTGTVTITDGNIIQTVSITQAAADVLTVSSATLDFTPLSV